MTKNPLALVTGASGNLGTAVVSRLTASGWRVARIDRNVMHLGEEFDCEVDLGDHESVKRAFFEATRRAGQLSAVVHTVGTYRGGRSLIETGDEDFNELFQVNVMTTVHVLRAALAVMQPQAAGNIAVVCSRDAALGRANSAAYAASKAAQLRIVESAAAEAKAFGVRVNAVLPGTLDTPQNRSAMPDVDPRSRLQLRDVAEVLTYLVSNASLAIHGQAITL